MSFAFNIPFKVERKSPPTARDYVQDGLVHLIDGIENVAYGVHDPSVGMIYDCITGFDTCRLAEIESGGAWLKNSCIKDSRYEYSYSDDATITTVFTPNDYGWWLWEIGSFLALDGYEGNIIEVGPHLSGRYPIATYMPKYSGDSLARVNGSFVKNRLNCATIVWHGSSKTFDVYVDDVFKGSADCSSVWVDGMTKWSCRFFTALYFTENYKFVLHNGRCYNRALSASEIAANYAVDKIRFNIQ